MGVRLILVVLVLAMSTQLGESIFSFPNIQNFLHKSSAIFRPLGKFSDLDFPTLFVQEDSIEPTSFVQTEKEDPESLENKDLVEHYLENGESLIHTSDPVGPAESNTAADSRPAPTTANVESSTSSAGAPATQAPAAQGGCNCRLRRGVNCKDKQ
eukprot:TRINITY_DN21920_c0_g1_i1.p1 TRINITY_DN21920_c0_g1~~TRINITY_DN21920_c0_g1_i1.p1  ORF type:complete len:155 (+),score=48.70 TRINITY_DN21920_c0_g1_i1:195-659(+)